MTEHVGRHAAGPEWAEGSLNPPQPADEPDTLILSAPPWMDDDQPSLPEPSAVPGPASGFSKTSLATSAGRHASRRRAADPDAAGLIPAPRSAPATPGVLGSPVVRGGAGRGSSRPGDGQPPRAGTAGVPGVAPRAGTAGDPGVAPRAGTAGDPGVPPRDSTAASALHAAVNGSGPAAVAAPGPAGQRRAGPSALRLVWVYPDLLSTYGDRGNMLVLSRRARLRGIEVQAIQVNSDQPVPGQGDIYLLGGGEDLPQILAAKRLRADGGLAAAVSGGSVVFAVCAGYQVIGHEFGGVEGEPVDGLGLLDISSGRGERRGVGELVADVDPELGVPKLTGFENHQGVTTLGAGARPLARISLGVGNGDGTEGAYSGKILGTYLHGPALARNPGLADLLLSWVVGQLAPIDPADEEWAARLRMERLAAVAQ